MSEWRRRADETRRRFLAARRRVPEPVEETREQLERALESEGFVIGGNIANQSLADLRSLLYDWRVLVEVQLDEQETGEE